VLFDLPQRKKDFQNRLVSSPFCGISVSSLGHNIKSALASPNVFLHCFFSTPPRACCLCVSGFSYFSFFFDKRSIPFNEVHIFAPFRAHRACFPNKSKGWKNGMGMENGLDWNGMDRLLLLKERRTGSMKRSESRELLCSSCHRRKDEAGGG